MNCRNCGTPQQEGARFCPSCGQALGAAAAAEAPTQVLPSQPAVPAPAQPVPTQPVPTQPTPPAPPPPDLEAQRRRSRNRTISIIAAVVALALAAVAALFLLPGDDDYVNQLQDVLVPVIDSNRNFNDAARKAEGGGSTKPLVRAAEDAATDARRALDEAVTVEGGTTNQASVVREALEAEIAYADAVADRGGWDSIQLERLGVEAENTGARLAGLVPEFEPLVSEPVVNVVKGVEQRKEARSAAGAFADDVDAVIADAAPAYAGLNELEAGVEQGEFSVAEASSAIDDIVNTRSAALQAANSLSAPDSDAANVKALLAESLRLSLENDEAFKQAVGRFQTGEEAEFLQDAYDDAYAPAARATAKKREFAAAYNAYLGKAGLPRNANERF